MTDFIDLFKDNIDFLRTYNFDLSGLLGLGWGIWLQLGVKILFRSLFIPSMIFVYFIPSYMAYKKNNKFGFVFFINFMTGFTLLGRVGALVIAMYDND